MKTKKFFIVTGILAVALVGGYILFQESKKKKSASVIPGTDKTEGGTQPTSKVITNYDSTWDYKLENGIWYTKKKAASVWQQMKDVASNYDLAVKKLTEFMNK